MKKILIYSVLLILLASFSAFAEGQINVDKITKEELIAQLQEISLIDNDIARLEAYDKLVKSFNLNSKTAETNNSSSNIVVEHYGNGMKTTRPFTVNGPWEMQWNAGGDIFQVFLYEADGDLVNIVANQMGAGEGSYYNPQKGTYYIVVNAMGKWELKIIRVNQ